MENTQEFAVRIAEEISPDEADFALIWAEAFIAGGKQRQELYAQTNAQAAGFLPGDIMPVLPLVFKGLVLAAPTILAVLTSDLTVKLLDMVKNALAVGEVTIKGKNLLLSSDKMPVSDPSQKRLGEIMSKLDGEIKKLGLSQAKTDRISLTVIRLLLEHPLQAAEFVEKLVEKK